MKKRILLLTAIAAAGSCVISSYQTGAARNGYDCTGAEAAGTGSFANPTGCYVAGGGCHSSAATTSIGVLIELDSAGVPTTHYKGGMTYTVKITGTPTGTSNTHYGFQLNALKGTASSTSNADAGSWSATVPSGTRLTMPSSYTQLTCMEHASPQTMSGSSFSQSFTWTAPMAGTGTISFWGAANFVNYNGNADAGDVWNTNHVTIAEWPVATTSVAAVAKSFIRTFPNPVSDVLNIAADGQGQFTAKVYDLFGRVVANVAGASNQSVMVSTNSWPTGVYEVVLEKDGRREVMPVIKK